MTVPPGRSGRYAFTFRPPQFVAGLVLFDVALIVTLLLWRRRIETYFFGRISAGSATTIATASPFGDTASRVIAPS